MRPETWIFSAPAVQWHKPGMPRIFSTNGGTSSKNPTINAVNLAQKTLKDYKGSPSQKGGYPCIAVGRSRRKKAPNKHKKCKNIKNYYYCCYHYTTTPLLLTTRTSTFNGLPSHQYAPIKKHRRAARQSATLSAEKP